MEIRDKVLPLLKPHADQSDIQAVTDVLNSGWWGKGPKVEQFEAEFASMVGAKHAIAVTSNSHGQDLVMKAMGLDMGLDVISPTISFIATGIIPLWNMCSSTLADVDPVNLNIDPQSVRKLRRNNTKMVTAVNLAGVPADIDGIREFYNGFILEDCAHSCYVPGAGKKGDVAVWSFQAVKTLPTGDGGMVTTDDTRLYNKMKDMTWFGVSSTWSRTQNNSGYSWDYEVDVLGYKYYMIDLIAALGLSQLKKLPANLEWRRHIRDRYNIELNGIIKRPPLSETVQYYTVRVPQDIRGPFINYLADKKIHTSVHFKPLHKYDILKQSNSHTAFPVADSVWPKLVSLPCHAGMTDEDISYVIYWVNNYFDEVYR